MSCSFQIFYYSCRTRTKNLQTNTVKIPQSNLLIMIRTHYILLFYLIIKMSDFTEQTCQQDHMFVSLLDQKKQYNLLCSIKVHKRKQTSLVTCELVALNETKEIIKIKNDCLKIELNRLILHSNVHISSTGFKLKLHPVKGTFVLEYSFFCPSHVEGREILELQNPKRYFQLVLKELQDHMAVKTALIQIFKSIEKGSYLPNRQAHINQILKFSFNSTFYGWVEPRNEFEQDQKEHCHQNKKKKNQKWSDCSSDSEQIQTDQSFNERKRSFQLQEQKPLSSLYTSRRTHYNNLSLLQNNNNNNQGNLEQSVLVSKRESPLVKFFISESEDKDLYNNYLSKYVLAANYSYPKEIHKSSSLKTYILYSSKKNLQLKTQHQLGINVFLQANRLSLSKTSRWKIILNFFKKTYNNFMNNQLKMQKFYHDFGCYYVEKGLKINFKRKDNQHQNSLFSRNFQYNLMFSSNDQQNLNIIEEQQKLAGILLSFIHFVFFTSIQSNKAETKRIKNEQRIDNSQSKMTLVKGIFEKFKALNLELQLILLFLYEKALNSKNDQKGIFGDWMMIIGQYYRDVIQNTRLE